MKFCENCGGKFKIDGKNYKLICEYCGYEKSFAQQCDLFDLKAAQKKEQMKVYRCGVCGIDFLYDKDEYYKKCPHCNNDLNTGEVKEVAVNGVIPFKIDENSANELLIYGITKRFFAPSSIKKGIKNLGVKKVYFPAKFFYAKSVTNYTAVYESGSGNDTTRDRHSGTIKLDHKIFIETSKAINKNFGTLLDSYDARSVTKYFPECVIDAPAEVDIEPLDTAVKKYRQKSYNQIIRAMSNAHFGTMRQHTETISYYDEKVCNVLLPCYFVEYNFKDKKYINILNGETGKLYGLKPFSISKLLGIIFGLLFGGIILGAILLAL